MREKVGKTAPVGGGPDAIVCRGVTKRYDDGTVAVEGLDLVVRAGECFGLLGPNGAGKTTTIEMLEGLVAPTAGEVEVLGRRWATDATELRSRIGVSLQQTRLPDRLSVAEIVSLFASFYPRGRQVEEVLRLTSLEDKRRTWFERLSGGQKQRLAIACALVGDSELLFLDEPTTGLDPQSRHNLWGVVQAYKAGGRTVMLTTHSMDEAEKLCDRVGIIDHGRLIAVGTPAALIASAGGQTVVDVATDEPLDADAVAFLPGVRSVRTYQGGLVVTVDDTYQVVPLLLELAASRRRKITQMATHRTTLEDVFLRLTGRQLRE